MFHKFMVNVRLRRGLIKFLTFCGILIFTHYSYAQDFDGIHTERFAIGFGAAYVKFDTKLKFSNKENNTSIFIDPEGDLGLPAKSSVLTFNSAFRFSKKHSLRFSYFGVKRESVLLEVSENLDDVVLIDATASLTDKTNFYLLSYGYTLFRDERSQINGLFGINGLELKYVFNAQGQLVIDGETKNGEYTDEASFFVPLPLFGLDFSFAYTPRWVINTKVMLVYGKYQDVRAGALQTSINSTYKFTKHIGITMGLAQFFADVTIEDSSKRQDIEYGYGGAYLGVYFRY